MNLSTVFPGASPKALRKTVVLALILALGRARFLFLQPDLFRRIRDAQRRQGQRFADCLRRIPHAAVLACARGDQRAALGRSAEQLLSVADGRSPLRAARPRFALSDCDACGFGRAFAVRALHLCRVDSHRRRSVSRVSPCLVRRCLLSARARGHTAGRAASGRRSGAGSFISLLLSRRIGDLSAFSPC